MKVAAAFTQFNRRSNANPSNLTSGAVDSTGWGFSSPFVTSPGGAGTDQQRIMGVGGTYDFGGFKLSGPAIVIDRINGFANEYAAAALLKDRFLEQGCEQCESQVGAGDTNQGARREPR